MNRALRVLHVSATFTAGVYEAIKQYTANTPAVEHHLLVEQREFSVLPPVQSTAFLSGKGPRSIREIGRAAQRVSPDVVHVHSSWAGLWARVALSDAALIYQPHALAAEGYGSTRSLRFIYSIVEGLLARRTQAFIALSNREHALLTRFANGRPVFMLENTSTFPPTCRSSWVPPARPAFGMMGRISPQKDPAFFARFARVFNEKHPTADFVWVGDGDARMRTELEAAGVRVTGWLDGGDVVEELSQLSMYVHTSLYEGFSLSLLDAALVGVPILLRDVPSSDGIELEKFNSVSDAVALAARTVRSNSQLNHLHERSAKLTDRHSPATQRQTLMAIYGATIASAPGRSAEF